ncbi:MAG: acetyl-CoA C-acyltransferase [Acidobacteria bacterium]|nr:acetyl-CoA C-acyltransferase [Acidobacteriota bacterium]MCW5968231.1 acetyl-CoA C-acyltransferase [Blastocatellales bacterium]
MREAVIVNALRTPIGKAPRGTLKDTRPDDLAAAVVRELMARTPELGVDEVEDVVIGCATPEAQQGANMARQVALLGGLPVTTSAMTINRFCSSGLQAIANAAEHIICGSAEVAIGGGAESMSMLPMGGYNLSPNPTLVDVYPDVYLNMGLTAENVARKYGIEREAAEEFAVRSHQRAAAAIDAGKFREEIVPVAVRVRDLITETAGRMVRKKIAETEIIFDTDEGVRRDTTPEGLAKLKPVFHARGTVTAGTSSQMSDGAAAALVMTRERAEALGLKPMARFITYATAGVPPEEMGIGPVAAIPKALRAAGLKLSDIDLIELNEAFAAQALAVMKQLDMDPERVNVNGGALALGHPLGCTGAKLTATLLYEMKRTGARYGMVTMCVGGGMGAAGIFENLMR